MPNRTAAICDTRSASDKESMRCSMAITAIMSIAPTPEDGSPM